MAITGSVDLGDGLQAVTVDHDPTAVATDVSAGSIIIDANGDHFRKLDSGSTTNVTEANLKANLAATVNPGVSDDNTADYEVGSNWVNVTSDEAFIAVDVSTGAAIWKSLTSATGLPVPDTTSIVEGSLDASKEMRIEVDGLTTATVRVATMPNKDITWDDVADPRTDNDAIHDNVAAEISAITEKVTPIAADLIVIEDSAAANVKKKVQVGNLPGGAALPVVDSTSIVEGSADATKEMRIEVDGLTTATVRVLTMPDGDITPVNFAGQLGGTALLPDVRGVRETDGPTLLTMGAILARQGLVRSGNGVAGFNYTYVKTSENLVSLVSGAANGEVFILESGTHSISAPIVFGPSLFNVSIIGTRGSIIAGTGASIANMMEIGTTINGLRLEGFTFEVRTGDGNAIKVTGATHEVVIKDIAFIKQGTTLAGNCIEFALGTGVDASKWTISGCFTSQGDAASNWLNFITTDATTSALSLFKVLNNFITSTGILASSSGIRFLTTGGLSRSIIQGNVCENLDTVGIQIENGSNNLISTNIIRLGINLGLDIKCNFSSIENNLIDTATLGIVIEGNNVTCDTNLTNDCPTAIVVREGAQRSILSNNIILGGTGHDGIELRSSGAGVGDEHRIIGNIISGTDRGIELQDGEDVVISDNHIVNLAAGVSPVGVGIWFSAVNVRRIQVRDNYIEPNKEGILDASDNGFHTIQDNEIRGGTIGVSIVSGLDGDGVTVKGNKLITQSDSAIEIFFDADGPIVTENVIRGATFAGVIVLLKRNTVGATKLQVNGNIITNCSSATRCIQVDDANGAQVNDNRIASNGGDGIRLENADDCSVSNNHITGQSGDGIEVISTSDNNDLFGNRFDTITGLNLRILGTGCRTDRSLNPFLFTADQFENPNDADWTVNALAPAVADSNNAGLTVRLFDDTAEEGIGFTFFVPLDAQKIKFKFKSRAETGPAGVRTVGVKIYTREALDNAAVSGWSTGDVFADVSLPITTEFFQYDQEELSLTTLGLTTGRIAQFELTRINPVGGTELTGDWALLSIEVVII